MAALQSGQVCWRQPGCPTHGSRVHVHSAHCCYYMLYIHSAVLHAGYRRQIGISNTAASPLWVHSELFAEHRCVYGAACGGACCHGVHVKFGQYHMANQLRNRCPTGV